MKNLIAPSALRRATLLALGLLAAGMTMLVSARIPQQQVTFAGGVAGIEGGAGLNDVFDHASAEAGQAAS